MGTQLSLKRAQPPLSAHVYCGHAAEWINMLLGTKVRLGPGHSVLDGDPAPPTEKGGTATSIFGPCLLWPKVAHLSYCCALVQTFAQKQMITGTSGYATMVHGRGAIRIAVRQLSQTWKLRHYDVIDEVITQKL